MAGHQDSGIASRLLIISVLVFGLMLICSSELASGNQPPSFLDLQSIVYLQETTSVGVTIFQLKANDVDDQAVTFDVELSPDSGGGNNVGNNVGNDVGQNILNIKMTSAKTADVILASRLNYSVSSQYKFNFKVSDGVNVPVRQTVLILVVPATYLAPTIENLPTTVKVAEDAAVGTQVYRVQAKDSSSVVTFTLQNSQGSKFAIDPISGTVRNTDRLDYHVQKTHRLEVVATNRHRLNATSVLTVEINSAKNRPPYFLEAFFTANISEDLPQGSSVFTMQAFDGNTDLPTDISYKMIAGYPGLFSIDVRSGLVSTAGVVDCSLAPVRHSGTCRFNVVVEACQPPLRALGSSCSTVLLVVSVTDVNDHAPSFSRPVYDCYVYKFAPPNTPIGCSQGVSVKDDDMGENARFSLSLQPGNVSDWLSIRTSSNSTNLVLEIKNSSALGSSPTNQIQFMITAAEVSTTERRSSVAAVSLHLLADAGDKGDSGCSATGGLGFTSDEYHVVLNAVPSPGVSITTVKATSGYGEEIVYKMAGSYRNIFGLDNKTGNVVVTRPDLMDSTKGTYAFPVMATGRSGLALAVVVVRFDLEGSVRMAFDVYSVSLDENSPTFDRPLFIKAQTPGRDVSLPSVVYFLAGASEYDGNFTVDPASGELRPREPLDYEALSPGSNGVVALGVGAKLAGGGAEGSGGSKATVTVVVKDMNDNSPKFTQPSYDFSPNEPLKRGLLGKVSALDGDSTRPNNQVVYYLKSTSTTSSSSSSQLVDGDFSIDPITGSIYYLSSSSSSSSPSPRNQTLLVTAVDLGTPARSSTVSVRIRYVPDSATSSSSSSSSCAATEHFMSTSFDPKSGVGSVVMAVPDTVRDSVLRWSTGSSSSSSSSSSSAAAAAATGGSYRCFLTNVHLCDGRRSCRPEAQGARLFDLGSGCTRIRVAEKVPGDVRTVTMTLTAANGSSTGDPAGARCYAASVLLFADSDDIPLDRPLLLSRFIDARPRIESTTRDGSALTRIVAVDPLGLATPVRFALSSVVPAALPATFLVDESSGVVSLERKNDVDFSVHRSVRLTVRATADGPGGPNALLGLGAEHSEANVTVELLPCDGPEFVRDSIVVGIGRGGERVESLLVDLKDFTRNWQPSSVYNSSRTMATVDMTTSEVVSGRSTADLLSVDRRGLVTFRGPVQVGTSKRLEVEVNSSTPNCGRVSSTKLLIYHLSDENLVQFVSSTPPETFAETYRNLTDQLSGISGLWINPYAVYRGVDGSTWTYLLSYGVDPSSKKLLLHRELLGSLENVTTSKMDEFKRIHNIVAIEPFSGNFTMFPSPSPSSSSSSSSSCRAHVIGLCVISALCFLLVVFLIALFLHFRKRRKKKSKDVAISYSTTLRADYLRTDKDEDKDVSAAASTASTSTTSSSTSSQFSSATSVPVNSTGPEENFILRRPQEGGTLVLAADRRQSCVYDSLGGSEDSDVRRAHGGGSQPAVLARSTVSLAPSKFSDSAIGSSDNLSASRFVAQPRRAPRAPVETVDQSGTKEEPSSSSFSSSYALYGVVDKGSKVAPGQGRTEREVVRSPPSYDDYKSVSLLKLNDGGPGGSFYI